MGSSSMPTLFALRRSGSPSSALEFITGEQNREHYQFLRTSGAVVSPYTRFEAEPSEAHPGWFHLKSSFNNKYWVRKSNLTADRYMNNIVAAADEKEENPGSWACTLFQPGGNNNTKTFAHRASNSMLFVSQAFGTERFAQIGRRNQDFEMYFVLVDWASLLILPKYVAFKADNGRYLRPRWLEGRNHLQFSADKNDGSDPSVIHELSYTPDGRVQFRSLHLNRYWINSNQWILADSVSNTAISTEFEAERDQDDSYKVILTSFLNNSFNFFVCRRFDDIHRDRLRAPDRSIIMPSKFEFEECVKSREITDIQYLLQYAKFYGDGPRRADSLTAMNYDQNNDDTATLSYTFTKTISSTWTSSNSVTRGVTTSVKGRIPFVGKIGVDYEVSFAKSTEHSETTEMSEEIEAAYTAVVPAGHSITIFGTVREVSAYIPYSYMQIDTLFDDRVVRSRKDDGIYHVKNGYDFYLTRTAPEKL